MDKKQLMKMARDIEKSNLAKNKIAQELVSEIHKYLNAPTVKKALFDIDGVGNPSAYKDYFFYWALASLTKLKQQGAVELLAIDIPQPSAGQRISEYVQSAQGSAQSSAPSFMRRRQRGRGVEQAETTPLKEILDSIWAKGGTSFGKRFEKAPRAFVKAYKGRMEMAEYATRKSGDWAFATSGHNVPTTDTGRKSSRQLVWDSILSNTESTGSLVSDVLKAMKAGVWDKVFNPLSWKRKALETAVSLDEELGDESNGRSRYESIGDRSYDPETQTIKRIEEHEEVVEGIMEANPNLNWFEAEDFAKKLSEQAKEVAENSVDPVDVDDPELKKSMEAIKALDLEIGALKTMSSLLKDERFHWLFDSHIYLNQWEDFYQNFDAEAMTKLDALIKQSGQKNLAIALRGLVNIKSTDKMKALTHFIENCMDTKMAGSLLKGKPGVAYLIWLCIKAKGSFEFMSNGIRKTIPADTEAFPSHLYWSDVRSLFVGMTETEKEKFSADMKKMLNDLAPMKTVKAKVVQSTIDYILKYFTVDVSARKSFHIGDLVRASANYYAGPKGLFYSVVASEIIRYRYYMDLDLADLSSDPLVPNSLGNSACDNSVRLLIPQLPDQILNGIKKDVVETESLPEWAEDVADALEQQIKSEERLKKNLTTTAKKLVEALKAEDKGTAKKARLIVARLLKRNR